MMYSKGVGTTDPGIWIVTYQRVRCDEVSELRGLCRDGLSRMIGAGILVTSEWIVDTGISGLEGTAFCEIDEGKEVQLHP